MKYKNNKEGHSFHHLKKIMSVRWAFKIVSGLQYLEPLQHAFLLSFWIIEKLLSEFSHKSILGVNIVLTIVKSTVHPEYFVVYDFFNLLHKMNFAQSVW